MYTLVASKRFQKDLKRLLKRTPTLEVKIDKTLSRLFSNPKHPSLRLHKLAGIGQHYSVSVDMSVRIIATFVDDKIFLLRIGTHDEVY